MSVGSFIGGGTAFLRNNLRLVAIWAALYLVVIVALLSFMRPMLGTIMDFQRQVAMNKAMGVTTPPVFPAGMFGSFALIELGGLLLMLVAFAAVVRAAAREESEGFLYLRVGMDELRLIGLTLLIILLALAAEFVAILVLGILGGVLGAMLGAKVGIGLGIVLGIILFCAAIYAQVRLSLAGVLTVIQHRIVIKDAWRVTKGQFWSLFLSYLVLGIIYLMVSGVDLAITSPGLISAYSSLDPRAVQAAGQAQMAQYGSLSIAYILKMAVGAILIVPWSVIMIGGMTTTAQELSGLNRSVARQFD
jgi:hypothetical protein